MREPVRPGERAGAEQRRESRGESKAHGERERGDLRIRVWCSCVFVFPGFGREVIRSSVSLEGRCRGVWGVGRVRRTQKRCSQFYFILFYFIIFNEF